jgi:hypothetical protein
MIAAIVLIFVRNRKDYFLETLIKDTMQVKQRILFMVASLASMERKVSLGQLAFQRSD